MRLHRLAVRAFGPFAAVQEIDFDALSGAGIFLLHGATGAGKTSVLDAVCFALYGGVPGARQGGSLRSDHADAGTPTEVELELTVAGRRLRLTRRPAQPRPKKRGSGFTEEKAVSLLVEWDAAADDWKGLSRSHQEIGEEIGQLLGMTREQFCQVVLLPQGDFARFLRADAQARATLLGRLFDTRRFAAVEDRLAELRRGAHDDVRAGDERLLGLAHRIEQAADSPEAPRPELAPGDPGIGEELLQWAAQVRTGARERRDIDLLAARTAEQAHAAATDSLEEARDLARLQQAHADARRREAALDGQRPERDRAAARLDRARAADAVTPALDLRAAADTEHRSAAAAEQQARALLPDGIDTEPADQLAARERRVRRELGSLEAARRAESRSADLAAELDGLERESSADEEIAREADAWLESWDATREGLQRRLDAAQEAATRAEQLAARLAPARRTAEAAHRRDTLRDQVTDAERHLLDARETAAAAHQAWLDMREARLLSIAAELAAGLEPGADCPVCGSAEHPAPARPQDDHVDKETEERALAEHRRLERLREDAQQRLRSLSEALAAAEQEVAEGPTDTVLPAAGRTGAEPAADRTAEPSAAALAAVADQLAADERAARLAAGDAFAAREALDAATAEHDRRTARAQEARRRAAARTSRREALLAERATVEHEVAKARGDAPSVAARTAELDRQAELLLQGAEAARRLELSALRLKEADARLADAAYRAGFDTPMAAADAWLDAEGRRALQHRLDGWQREEAAVAAVLGDARTTAAAARPPADVPAAQTAADIATRRLRAASAAEHASEQRCADLDRLSADTADGIRELAPVRAAYDRIARLAGLAAGTSAENERKMRLESYVLAARLEQVAHAASVRLARMSGGRYTLVHSDTRDKASGRGRSGLGLHVIDAWTGAERDTATLSGGESFFASLALALGLADVVTEEAGGVRLDTLFIDEGFGSLDEQTLDEVLDVLDGLRERDRTVGIVSHVPDLRRRIPVQLEVLKGRSGSEVRHHTTALTSSAVEV
ncbi:SMC family ATPase [Streptomyces sp. A7024]|uniref:Nuclease SbcCD subunit C n=1 Tax=Streptomyces coryli TaxID=1128680 RepID=A0A6G4TSL5_9ACTN|nr:SMC family ATPase [Streptomyces coryli]NGN62793.1 SMC family ATPase [Streptomyces coryli]